MKLSHLQELELRIETQKQTLQARDESIKKLLEMLQNKGMGKCVVLSILYRLPPAHYDLFFYSVYLPGHAVEESFVVTVQ